MACSGVWIEKDGKSGLRIGVTDYDVSEFGGEDWEWSASFDEENANLLIASLRKNYGDSKELKEILTELFGQIFSTIEFVKYCDSLGIKYAIRQERG